MNRAPLAEDYHRTGRLALWRPGREPDCFSSGYHVQLMMRATFDKLLVTLDAIRADLVASSARADLPAEAVARHYNGIDLAVRELLLAAVGGAWDVPDDLRKKARRVRSIPLLVGLARDYAPPAVNRDLLSRIAGVYHVVRNEIEHQGRQVTIGDALEYLEVADSVAYSVLEPAFASLPDNLLDGLDGYEAVGAFKLAKGQQGSPW